MANTVNNTFSVKNGLSVANTIVLDSNRNLSNVATANIAGTLYVGNTDLYGLINTSPQLLTMFQLASVIYGGVPNTTFGGTNNLDGGTPNTNYNGQQTLDAAANPPLVPVIVGGSITYTIRTV